MLLGKYFLTFWRIALPLSSGSSGPGQAFQELFLDCLILKWRNCDSLKHHNYSPSDAVSHTRRLEYSATLLWETQISQYLDYVLKRSLDIFHILSVYIGILCDLCVHLFEIQISVNISFVLCISCRTPMAEIYCVEGHKSLLLIKSCINRGMWYFVFVSIIYNLCP